MVQQHFDVFITIDKGFEFEHKLKTLKIGLVIIHVSSNKLESYRGLAIELLRAIEESTVRPGSPCSWWKDSARPTLI